MKKIILITGSTDGIGKATALKSAENGSVVIIHGKDKDKVIKTTEEIKNKTKNNEIYNIICDFTDLNDVKQKFSSLPFDHLDILINNACTFKHHYHKTKDGYEYTFQICYLAHFVLTGLLLPLLIKADQGKIINVSSMVHAHSLNLSFLETDKYDGYTAYEVSKLANVLFTYELAKRLKNTHITVNCLHPGVISTKLLHSGWGIGGASVKVGADNLYYLAFSKEVAHITGKYFFDKKVARSSSTSYDKKILKEFWEYSEKLTNFKYNELG